MKYSGKSESDFIREILIGSVVKESNSYNKGYADGFNKFAVDCYICKKPLTFNLKTEPETLRKILDIFGHYAHESCFNNQERQQKTTWKR